MAYKKEDEIMAEYLLKGGKMLEKVCKTCGCPMFEYKKKTFCVVCAEHKKEQDKKDPLQAGANPISPPPFAGTGGVTGHMGTPGSTDTAALEENLISTVRELCCRIQAEKDPDRCLTLMDAVKIGSETLQILRQV
jgi:UPF0148 protein